MIEHLDNLLRHLFISEIDVITSEAQVRFEPPDEDWRNEVVNLQDVALNVYLVDLRENRDLRTNARVRTGVIDGQVIYGPAPARLDCHYIISAWSPAQPGPAVEPALDEHSLLYKASAALINNAPINPSRIYPAGSAALLNTPEIIRDADLPVQVLPVDGFPKLAEFWGTMGMSHRWKPSLYLVATLPVVRETEMAGPMVTTTVIEYRHRDRSETAEIWVQIGGHVLDAVTNPANPTPVPGAWVRVERVGGQPVAATTTDEQGRFIFRELQPGQYQLSWRAPGFPPPAAPRVVDVPSPSGKYDLSFE